MRSVDPYTGTARREDSYYGSTQAQKDSCKRVVLGYFDRKRDRFSHTDAVVVMAALGLIDDELGYALLE